MGSNVDNIEKELNVEDSTQVFLILAVILGSMYFFGSAFGNLQGAVGAVAGIASILVFPFALGAFISDLYKLKADPQRFLNAYRSDEPHTPEIEIMEKAYLKALKHVSEAFRDMVILWLAFGTIIGLDEIAVMTGSLEIKKLSLFWAFLGIASILSFASFVLMIIFYLRKRSIEKALFAIQLKKSDKAEIAIKI